jgi:hypothetical protein
VWITHLPKTGRRRTINKWRAEVPLFYYRHEAFHLMANAKAMAKVHGKDDYETIAMIVSTSSMVFLWCVVSSAFPLLG